MRIVLFGACGRMGTITAEQAQNKGHVVVCGVDLVQKPMSFPLYRTVGEAEEEADVAIDFSAPAGTAERLEFCARRNLPIVLAATGYTAEEEKMIARYGDRIALFKTGNLSLGVNVLQALVRRAAAALREFDVEIVERHHNQKKDAPSGTALMLVKSVEEGRGEAMERVFGRQGMTGARGKGEIGIHAVRGGDLAGEHEVMFAGGDETVTLSHAAQSRRVFADGAVKAAEWLAGREAGLYGMDDLLGKI